MCVLASYDRDSFKAEEETVAEPEQTDINKNLTSAQQRLSELWEEHVRYEFSTRNTEGTLATMVEDAYVNHVPVLTGGVGRDQLREFYSNILNASFHRCRRIRK